MKEYYRSLLTLATYAEHSSNLLCEAITGNCHTCVAEISDLNRQAIAELAEIERRLRTTATCIGARILFSAYALADCTHRAFDAALLLTGEMSQRTRLEEIALCNCTLAEYPRRLLEGESVDFFALHLCANKARGAHALLLSGGFSAGSRTLLPLLLALQAHRDQLENACGTIPCEAG